eukprot:g11252.t1
MDKRSCFAARLLYLCTCLVLSQACLDVKTARKRAPAWVGIVPYSHAVNKTWGYPTDCSGYIDWVTEVGKDVKAFAWGSSDYSSPINASELRFGDIFTHVFGKFCSSVVPFPYVDGHVFLFDKWDSEKKTHFWAYESTSKADQTPGCLNGSEPCFNHYVKKELKKYMKWEKESCKTLTHSIVRGGPRRISPSILCSPSDRGITSVVV